MAPLPPQLLPATPVMQFSIFELAIPNIIVWCAVVLLFVFSIFSRLPSLVEMIPGDVE